MRFDTGRTRRIRTVRQSIAKRARKCSRSAHSSPTSVTICGHVKKPNSQNYRRTYAWRFDGLEIEVAACNAAQTKVRHYAEAWIEVPARFRGRYVATIGNFDGVHLGHQEMIGARARPNRGERGWKAAVSPSTPHPSKVARAGFARRKCIMSRRSALSKVMGDLGVQEVLMLKFDGEISRWKCRRN